MSSIDRLNIDGDKVFIPTNVDGGYNDSFNTFSSGKIYTLLGVCLIYLVIIVVMLSNYFGMGLVVVVSIVYWLIGLWVIRKFVINEKYYYNIISKMKDYELTTPSVFWGISDIVDTDYGAILHYVDSKVGLIVRLNKSIITGKNSSDRDLHFDTLSDFYGNIVSGGYKFVQFNKMETLGKDTRLQELDKLISNPTNKNLKKLMEFQVGYLKSSARETLYETDYILVYTEQVLRRDNLLTDVLNYLEVLSSNSNYNTFDVLDKGSIIELVNSEYGTRKFDYVEATMGVFKGLGSSSSRREPVKITELELPTGDIISLTDTDLVKIKQEVVGYKGSGSKKEVKNILDVLGRNEQHTNSLTDTNSSVSVDISEDSFDIEIGLDSNSNVGLDDDIVIELD